MASSDNSTKSADNPEILSIVKQMMENPDASKEEFAKSGNYKMVQMSNILKKTIELSQILINHKRMFPDGGYVPLADTDNEEIFAMVEKRLELGKERYGHGMIIDEDTTKHGTEFNDWDLMALEEYLDAIVYMSASYIRKSRRI